MATNNSWNDDIEAANSNITLNAGTNTINIGTDSTNNTCNFGTGGGNKSVTIGSATGSSTTLITSGSGGVTLASTASNAPITFLPNGTGVVTTANALQSASLSFDSGTNVLSTYVTTASWTPVLQFGGLSVGVTYTAQQGVYTRIGNIVFITAVVNISSKGSSTGNSAIAGLPVAPGTSIVSSYIFDITGQALTFTNTLTCYMTSGGVLNIATIVSGTTFSPITNSGWTTGTQVIISGWYSAV